ncbi:ABC transporter ATP-binding protein [Rhodoplanes sp. Z2-YC6860]|uniref:ABC transporter ATP-binding protein n=1 Tax=Rhodoplanes sp. Z2-YC6860 TaxID=674703 RepID=UPI003FA772DE
MISVENLSKRYLIGHQSAQRERYTALRDVVSREVRNFLRKASDLVAGRQIVQGDEVEDIWALKDVNFEVKQGEAVGIIGRNGAGKSTLLKILSRITEPSSGLVKLRGRVGSLLEVGTGFHPELTGRENIYLNGAILGMSRKEIRRKFDEIVDFADVEKFLDTPVKRYSSGMYVRLAFAVAAHMETEILVVDEVLAVGDAQFQQKCLGKMTAVAQQGRTVLFVSHNMVAVRNLCNRTIVLSGGSATVFEDVASGIRLYAEGNGSGGTNSWLRPHHQAITELGFKSISAALSGEQPDLTLAIEITLVGRNIHRAAMVAFHVSNELGLNLLHVVPSNGPCIAANALDGTYLCQIALPPLIPGRYWVTAWIGPSYFETFEFCRDCVSFDVTESPLSGRTAQHAPDHGFIVPKSEMSRCG